MFSNKFRLALPNDKGVLQWTAPIAFNATTSTVQAAVNKLVWHKGTSSSDATKMVETSVTAAGSVYTIEFKGCLAATDVPLMTTDASGLAGVFSVKWGDSFLDLGGSLIPNFKLAAIETSGAIGILGSVETTVTFVLSLFGDEKVLISPPVFKAGASIEVETLKNGGFATNEEQLLRVIGANGGTFKLTFQTKDLSAPQVTAPITWSATDTVLANRIELALIGLGKIGDTANIDVVVISTDYPWQLFRIVFKGSLRQATFRRSACRLTPRSRERCPTAG